MTRPDIAIAVGKCNRYVSNPTPTHDLALKRIVRYLAGSSPLGLKYDSREGIDGDLIGYTDSSYGDCLDARISTSGYAFMLWNGPITGLVNGSLPLGCRRRNQSTLENATRRKRPYSCLKASHLSAAIPQLSDSLRLTKLQLSLPVASVIILAASTSTSSTTRFVKSSKMACFRLAILRQQIWLRTDEQNRWTPSNLQGLLRC